MRCASGSSTPPVWTTCRGGDVWNDMIRRNVPLGRAGTGVDIANMVIFLASDAGAWVTGQSYNVDGGQVVAH